MLNSLEKDKDGQGVDIPQDKVHDLDTLSKLPSKKKAMLRLSTYGKTSSDVRHNFAKLSSERSDDLGLF